MILLICILTFFFFNTYSSCCEGNQVIVIYSGNEQTLQGRFNWAISESQTRQFRDGYWIVYSIQRMMNKHSTIGSYFSNLGGNRSSLYELITGITTPPDDYIKHDEMRIEDDSLVMKDIAICIHYNHEGKNTIEHIAASNLTLRVDFCGDIMIWISQAKDVERIILLQSLFPACSNKDTRLNIITSIGLHPTSQEYIGFLSDVIRNSQETVM